MASQLPRERDTVRPSAKPDAQLSALAPKVCDERDTVRPSAKPDAQLSVLAADPYGDVETAPPSAKPDARLSVLSPNAYSVRATDNGIVAAVGKRSGHLWGPTALTIAVVGAAIGLAALAKAPLSRAAEQFSLISARFSPPPAQGTLIATAQQPGVRLRLDGQEAGSLPLTLPRLKAGEHVLEFYIDSHYAKERWVVNVGPNEVRQMAPVLLKVVRGVASFDVRSRGASLSLISGDDRMPVLDPSRPMEIETSKPVAIEISKPGYQSMREPLLFEGNAEKTFVVDLGPPDVAVDSSADRKGVAQRPAFGGKALSARAAGPKTHPRLRTEASARFSSDSAAPLPAESGALSAESAPDTSAIAPDPVPESPMGSGGCTGNFNSLPLSNVVLDGRPLGQTPQIGASMPAGNHVVLFALGDSLKRIMFACTPGSKKTIVTRFSPSE